MKALIEIIPHVLAMTGITLGIIGVIRSNKAIKEHKKLLNNLLENQAEEMKRL